LFSGNVEETSRRRSNRKEVYRKKLEAAAREKPRWGRRVGGTVAYSPRFPPALLNTHRRKSMRVAISTDGSSVSPHFGRCPHFTIVDIEDGKLTYRELVENPGHQPGAIPRFLAERGVRCIIAGGMGMRATSFFNEQGIEAIVGVSGEIEDVIRKLTEGSLVGGDSFCRPGAGKGYGLDKTECDHPEED
jgi:predicted Fe-Mo cluster-binding NifX family protein